MSTSKSRQTKTGKPSIISRLPAVKRASKKGAEVTIDLKSDKNLKNAIAFIKRKFKGADGSPMPQNLKPMLAGISDEPFNNKDWQYEIKWDGYRSLVYLAGAKVEMRSRNNLSFNEKYKPLHMALQSWGINAVIDGEVVVLDEEGHADFEALQQWHQVQSGTLVFFVFDILWFEGINLMDKPLTERQEILKELMPLSNVIRFSESIDEYGVDFFHVAQQNGLEGIIAKKKNAPYLPASRAKTWLKIKAEQRHEAVICGYTKNKDTDRLFSSLVLGVPVDGKLKFIGQVGTGFNGASQKEIFKKMNPFFTKECPFDVLPNTGAPTMWVKPHLLCEVKYTELTGEGLMRHPSFQGIREDKTIKDINEGEIQLNQKKKAGAASNNKSSIKKAEPTKPLLDLLQKDALVRVNGHDLKFSNIQKIYWPKEKISKGDLINYYHQVAEHIMPYMKDRPQSLNRHPNGITGESFYQKDMKGKVENWMKTHRRFSDSTGEDKDFLVCTNEASLLYMANLGCIEMNPWHSRIQKPDAPDWSVIDLDPGSNTFNQVIETAIVVKKILDHFNITSFVKTSGSTGLHIYVPFAARYSYEQSKQFAELIANMVHDELPMITSIERNPLKRKDKIYVDYLQNRPIQTICAPYSVRPKPGATVSAPLHWDEVKKGLQMSSFTMRNMLERIKSEGDLFTGVLGKGVDLSKLLKQLSAT